MSRSRYFLVGSMSFLMVSGYLLLMHARAIRDTADNAVPLVAEVQPLERRRSFLAQQMELAELQVAMRRGSHDERIQTFVLPKELDIDRLLLMIDLLRDDLESQGVLADMGTVELGEAVRSESGVMVQSVSFDVSVQEDGIRSLLRFIRLAGLLSVADVLDTDEIDALLRRTEEENPAGIVALEQFLSTDILQYAQDYRSYDEQLRRSFGASFDGTIGMLLQSSGLRDARNVLGGSLGKTLLANRLWPLPLVTTDHIVLESGSSSGWVRLHIVLGARFRGA